MKKKILIIDDDKFFSASLREVLLNEGYDVILAVESESGYDLLEQEKPDLLLVDVLIPGLDGVSLCEKIRQNESLPHIPIILMTGVFTDLDIRAHVRRGIADDFIIKPYKEEDLISKIKKFLPSRMG